jgi:hypothetical protein
VKRPEQKFQIDLVRDLRRILSRDVFITAFPAGGGGARRGSLLKSMGLIPGCPDLFLFHQGIAHGLELKGPKGTTSKVQKEAHLALARAGVDVRIARNLDDALASLKIWGIPTRIRGPWEPRKVAS